MSFKDLGICKEICDVIGRIGWSAPSSIQTKTIPIALQGKDIVGLAETGSGKTAAFGIPILQNLLAKPRHNFGLILTPTRELALQIKVLFMELGESLGLKICCLVGGQHIEDQVSELKRSKFHVIVGTPGRIVFHLENTRELKLSHVRFLVLDEADQMLDETFEEHLQYILTKIHPNHRTYMFSATMTQNVQKIQKVCTKFPIIVEDSSKYAKVDKLDHTFTFLPDNEKDFYLVHLLMSASKTTENNRCIIFTATWRESFRLAFTLKLLANIIGSSAIPLNGQMKQDKRQANLYDFRMGKASILVATDLASRGLDFPEVDFVINYDVPQRPSWSDSAKAYIHRVGRTARAGRSGRAITLVTPYSATQLKAIEEAMGQRVPQLTWPGTNCISPDLRERIQLADKEAREKIQEKAKRKQPLKKKHQSSSKSKSTKRARREESNSD